MRIAITGSSGMIGSALTAQLRTAHHEVVPIRRNGSSWEIPSTEKADAVVHLAAESISAFRWTKAKKQRILESRTAGTAALVRRLRELNSPPRVFLSASATGYYGEQGDSLVTEDTPFGSGFLAQVCREWEERARQASAFAERVITLRFGIVFDRKRGALPKMLIPFRFGVAFFPGRPLDFLSWVSLHDTVRAIEHCLFTDTLNGPVNITSPNPVTHNEFIECFSNIQRTLVKLPSPPPAVLGSLFGEMGRELFLTSTRAVPEKLSRSGFSFEQPEIGDIYKTTSSPSS